MSKFKIRLATVQDAEAIAALNIKSWKDSYGNIVDSSYLNQLSHIPRIEKGQSILSSLKDQNIIFVAVDPLNKIIAFISAGIHRHLEMQLAEIYAMYVDKDHKNKGIGYELWNKVVEHFKVHGIKKFEVNVFKDNVDARKFYERQNGNLDKESREKIGDHFYDCVTYYYNIDNIDNINE